MTRSLGMSLNRYRSEIEAALAIARQAHLSAVTASLRGEPWADERAEVQRREIERLEDELDALDYRHAARRAAQARADEEPEPCSRLHHPINSTGDRNQ